MMAAVSHVTAWAGRTKYHTDGFLFAWVYSEWLAKNYKNNSIMLVDMDMVSVMAAYSDMCVCIVHCSYRKALSAFL